jgi:uncharacterized protein (DUF1501 family)
MKRRSFLTGMGAGLATLLARPNLRAFGAPGGATGHKTVVIVMQRGAVDGLAMIPPHGDPNLAKLRPSLTAKTTGTVDLDGHFGLHAGLAALAPHWKEKRLAIVPAVGMIGATRSHFEAQDYLEQGGIASAGTAPALVLERNGEVGIARKAPPPRRTQIIAAFDELYAAGTDPFSITARRALSSAAHIETALAAQPAPADPPKGPAGQALITAARLIRADVGAELILIDTNGWDTHVNEAQRLDRELAQLGAAIAGFATELGDRLGDVTLVTISEFGRTVHENGTGGTDHGTATMSLVLGGNVNGGRIVGTFPGLADDQRFEGRDLAITTDSRDLLADVLTGTLDLPAADLAAIFPDHAPKSLGLLRS